MTCAPPFNPCHADQKEEEAKLEERQRQVAEAERQARKRQAVERFRAERQLEARRQHDVAAVLTSAAAPSADDIRQREQRVQDALMAAAMRAKDLSARDSAPCRSERMLVEASEKLRLLRMGVNLADPTRLASQVTEAHKVGVVCALCVQTVTRMSSTAWSLPDVPAPHSCSCRATRGFRTTQG